MIVEHWDSRHRMWYFNINAPRSECWKFADALRWERIAVNRIEDKIQMPRYRAQRRKLERLLAAKRSQELDHLIDLSASYGVSHDECLTSPFDDIMIL